jgi:hypothetical protein
VKNKHFIFIIQNKINKINKKVKSFYKKLKPGDFTVAKCHGHPLVYCMAKVLVKGYLPTYGVA